MDIFKLNKIVAPFFLCGVVAGLVFATLTSRSEWQNLWFSVSEWWIVPSWRYWFLAQTLFVLANSAAYLWARSKGWLPPRAGSKFSLWTFVLGACSIAVILLWMDQLPALAVPMNFLLMPIALVTLLYMFSARWDGIVATFIFFTNVIVTLLASIPDLLQTSSFSLVAFQSLKAILCSGILAGLTGLWLARSTRPEV